MSTAYSYAFPIVPSDTNNFSFGSVDAIYVGTPGNVVVQMLKTLGEVGSAQSANVNFVIPQAMWLNVKALRVLANGTSASNLIGAKH